jgi:hypothetical protein
MTSAAKLAANRANARTSSGPKSRRGKAHSSKNARRHGLSLPIVDDPVLSKEVEALAREIACGATDRELHQLAGRVAEAQLELGRVRRARHQLFFDAFIDPD